MEPATLGMLFSAMSGVFSVVQGISGMQTEKQNAVNNKADANLAEAQGQAEATRTRQQTKAAQSQLLADTGASGTTTTGSPMEVYLANAKQGEIQAQDKIYAGKLKGRSLRMAAGINSRQASSQLLSGIGSGAASLGSLGSKLATPADTTDYSNWY
jgi:hypothetical protein